MAIAPCIIESITNPTLTLYTKDGSFGQSGSPKGTVTIIVATTTSRPVLGKGYTITVENKGTFTNMKVISSNTESNDALRSYKSTYENG